RLIQSARDRGWSEGMDLSAPDSAAGPDLGSGMRMLCTTRMVAIDELQILPELQPRVDLDEDTVDQYAVIYADLGPDGMDPIRAYEHADGNLVLTRGFHRVEAARVASLAELPCEVYEGQDGHAALLDALSGNRHGKHLTIADKRRSLALYHDALPSEQWGSTREVARLIGCSHELVATWRRERDRAGWPVASAQELADYAGSILIEEGALDQGQMERQLRQALERESVRIPDDWSDLIKSQDDAIVLQADGMWRMVDPDDDSDTDNDDVTDVDDTRHIITDIATHIYEQERVSGLSMLAAQILAAVHVRAPRALSHRDLVAIVGADPGSHPQQLRQTGWITGDATTGYGSTAKLHSLVTAALGQQQTPPPAAQGRQPAPRSVIDQRREQHMAEALAAEIIISDPAPLTWPRIAALLRVIGYEDDAIDWATVDPEQNANIVADFTDQLRSHLCDVLALEYIRHRLPPMEALAAWWSIDLEPLRQSAAQAHPYPEETAA
ncbi:MAG: hypothetical protein ACOCYN_03840, partial [Planctomycetota bacterium]